MKIVICLAGLIICFYFGMIFGVYIGHKQMQDAFGDAIDKTTSMFLNSVDKIIKSYETLLADFKNSSGLPSPTDKEGK